MRIPAVVKFKPGFGLPESLRCVVERDDGLLWWVRWSESAPVEPGRTYSTRLPVENELAPVTKEAVVLDDVAGVPLPVARDLIEDLRDLAERMRVEAEHWTGTRAAAQQRQVDDVEKRIEALEGMVNP